MRIFRIMKKLWGKNFDISGARKRLRSLFCCGKTFSRLINFSAEIRYWHQTLMEIYRVLIDRKRKFDDSEKDIWFRQFSSISLRSVRRVMAKNAFQLSSSVFRHPPFFAFSVFVWKVIRYHETLSAILFTRTPIFKFGKFLLICDVSFGV